MFKAKASNAKMNRVTINAKQTTTKYNKRWGKKLFLRKASAGRKMRTVYSF